MFRVLAALTIVLSGLFVSGTTAAQDAGQAASNLPESATRKAINEMVARMSDDEVRAFLIERLDAVSGGAATDEPLGFIQRIDAWWEAFSSPISEAISRLPVLPTRQADALATFADRLGGAPKTGG